MMFVTIRIAFWSMAFIFSILLIRKSKVINKRRLAIIAFVATIILTLFSLLIPIEKAIITFSSPKSAYSYNNPGDVKLIVEGENTDFIVGINDDTYINAIVPKANGGWKIGWNLDTKIIAHTISDGISIYMYQYKNTNDYFIMMLNTKGGPLDIEDNKNSEFKYLEKDDRVLDKTFYTYFAYINNFDNQYAITVNGNLIKIKG